MMIKVYSHPRSGTNYLCALLAVNFYPNEDLSTPGGQVGHWASRAQVGRNPHGQLFGGHNRPGRYKLQPTDIYIYRDGRDVALSLYRSKHFKNPQWNQYSFSEFCKQELDWINAPGWRAFPKQNIFQHWKSHLLEWANANVITVRYEKLFTDTRGTLQRIARHAGIKSFVFRDIPQMVGWFPTGGGVGRWRGVMSEEELEFYYRMVGKNFWGNWDLFSQ